MIQGYKSSIERLVNKFGAKPRSLETKGHREAKETQGPPNPDSRLREKSRALETQSPSSGTNASRVPQPPKSTSKTTGGLSFGGPPPSSPQEGSRGGLSFGDPPHLAQKGLEITSEASGVRHGDITIMS